jgi:hypothetical protein
MPHGHDVQSLAERNERAIRGADIPMRELTEYLDTPLVETVLEAPG